LTHSINTLEGKRALLERVYAKFQEGSTAIEELFGGKYHTFGSAETIRVTIAFLRGLSQAHRRFLIDVCISFMEKPKSIIIAGITKSGGDGKGWDSRVLNILPSYRTTMSEEDAKVAEVTKRKNLDTFLKSKGITTDSRYTSNLTHFKEVEEAFCKVNVTAVKNIALLAIMQEEPTPSGSTSKWLDKYNEGKPLSNYDTNPRRPSETEDIRAKMVKKFLDAYSMLSPADLTSGN
jgi:hypothetical protein